MGVSTTAQIVHELLPSPALTRLSTERFELPSAAASLDQLIQQLFSSRPFGFRLGAKSFRYVVDSYLYQHVSVHQLMRALQVPAPSIRPARRRRGRQRVRAATRADSPDGEERSLSPHPQYALMDHYFANPLAVLTEPMAVDASSDAHLVAILPLLTPVHAQAIRLLPSFQRCARTPPLGSKPPLSAHPDTPPPPGQPPQGPRRGASCRYCEDHVEAQPGVVKQLVQDDAYLLRSAVPQFLANLRDVHHRGAVVRYGGRRPPCRPECVRPLTRARPAVSTERGSAHQARAAAPANVLHHAGTSALGARAVPGEPGWTPRGTGRRDDVVACCHVRHAHPARAGDAKAHPPVRPVPGSDTDVHADRFRVAVRRGGHA